MERSRMVLALAATASMMFAACATARGGIAAARPPASPAREPRRRAGRERAAPSLTAGQPAAPVGAAGPVRRLLRGRRAGLLRGRRASTSRSSTAARTSSRRRSARRRTAPSSRSRGCPRCSRRARPASDLVNIAQIFQRSGTLSVSWKDSNITDARGLRGQEGRRLGLRQRVRGHRRRQEGRASSRAPTTEGHPAVRHDAAAQPKQIDVAEAMIYNEYAQVLEADEPRDRRAVPARRPQRHRLQRRRHGDAPGRASSRARRGSPRPATRTSRRAFLRASFQGWIYCRDNPAECVEYTRRRRARPLGAGPPGLDDERDQPADLAVARRHRRSWTPTCGSRRSTSRSSAGDHQGRAAGRRLPHRPRRGRPGRASPTSTRRAPPS